MPTPSLTTTPSGHMRLPARGAPRSASRAAAAVAALLAAVLALFAVGHPLDIAAGGSSVGRGPARSSSQELPIAAEGPVSAALGSHMAGYRVSGLRANNPAQRLSARFSSAGVAVTSGAAHLRLGLAGYGRVGAMRGLLRVAPSASANRVSYEYPGIKQWFANGPFGLEQGFDIAARPSGGHGPLALSLVSSSNVRMRLAHSGVVVGGAAGTLSYNGLTASDARGRTLHAWLGLRDRHVLINVDDRGAAYPVRIDPFVQGGEMTSNDGEAMDVFGASVAIDGDTIVASSFAKTVGNNAGQGAAYVFVKPASGWAHATQTAELTASDGAANDSLGSVAISGDTIVAGASDHKVANNANQGAVYVFVKPATGWADGHQTAELTAANGAANDILGAKVAISGDTVVASAPGVSPNGAFDEGAAYVFVKPDTGWKDGTQTARLTALDGAAQDSLGNGNGVAISGDTIVLGAGSHNSNQGAAYVYVKPDTGWADATQSAELTASDGAAGDMFGFAVSIDGGTVAVGALHHSVGLTKPGAAYVFVRPGPGWFLNPHQVQTAELTQSDGATEDRFGAQLGVSGNSIVVGSFLHQVGPNLAQGAAYVFTRPGFVWRNATENSELTADDGTSNDFFTDSVAISGNLVVAGAPTRTVAGNAGQGSLYVFGPPPTVTFSTPASGASFVRGTRILASYSCSPPAGATITSCTGPTAPGSPLDTATVGSHTLTATALDSDGIAASGSASYVVTPKPVVKQPKPVKPSIAALRQSAKSWRVGTRLAHVSRRRVPIGTTFSFTLNQPAVVTLTFARVTAGQGPRLTVAGVLRVRAHKGVNRLTFQGRLSKTRKLRPGGYMLQITATNAAHQSSATRSLMFTIIR